MQEKSRRSVEFLRSRGEDRPIDLGDFAVVGNYVRFDSDIRAALQNFCDWVSTPLMQSQPGLKTYLVWGPSGSGKSGLVGELGKVLKEKRKVGFSGSIDLARQSKEEYKNSLESFDKLPQPKLGWIDEIDSKSDEEWPYDLLFRRLPLERETERIVYVLSGSGVKGDDLEKFVERIAKRHKGSDVMSRTSQQKAVVPPLGVEDRILMVSSAIAKVLVEDDHSNSEGCRIEKLALHYLALAPELETARALSDCVLKALHRKKMIKPFSLNPRFLYDDLFESGDKSRQDFLSVIGIDSPEYRELRQFVKVVPPRETLRGRGDKEFSLPSKKNRKGNDTGGPAQTNLKAPPFGRFIRREDPYGAILKGLRERTTPIVLTGLVGTGKTSLAYEVAKNCSSRVSGHPHFEAVVWISDKSRPGLTTLNEVLDEIARTIDYPGLTQMELSQKRRAVGDQLRSRATLIILDSFETVTDQAVAEWLCEIPEPSKVLVTSQPHRRTTFPREAVEISLKGMTEEETRHFVEYQIARLGLEKLVKSIDVLAPLLRITQGNPKAIELGLGIVKRQGRPLDQVVADLSTAKPPFDAFCSTAWDLLDVKARRVLFAMYFFPYGTKYGPLREVVGLGDAELERSIDLLSDLGLLDNRRESINEAPAYSTHGLVLAFVSARLRENQGIETELRRGWLTYLRRVASGVGFCWNDIDRLEVLDEESLRNTIRLGVDWSLEHHEYSDTIAIARDVRYYFYVRGYWTDWSSEINLKRAEAARRSGDEEEEFAALTYQTNIASKQRNTSEAERLFKRLEPLADPKKRTLEDMIDYRHARALYLFAKGDLSGAEQLWRSNLSALNPDAMPHAYNANMRWFAACLEKQNRIEEADSLLGLALEHAQRYGFARGIADVGLKRAGLCLKRNQFREASENLSLVAPLLKKMHDGSHDLLPEYFYLQGRVEQEQRHYRVAFDNYSKALDGFKRLGKRDKIADLVNALASVANTKESDSSRS